MGAGASLSDGRVLRGTALILATRLAILLVALVVIHATDEPSRDLPLHAELAEGPWRHLTDATPALVQYPPLLGAAEAVTYAPWRALGVSESTSLRLGAIVWDVAAGWLVLATVRVIAPGRLRRATLLYAALPLSWLASAVMGQDEAIGAAFLVAAVWCLSIGRRGAAIAVAIAGLFVAKLLLVPLLVGLLVTQRANRRWRDAVAIATTLAALMGLLWLTTGHDRLTNQTGYRPEWVSFTVTPWGWLVADGVLTSRAAHLAGQLLAAVTGAVVLAIVLRRRGMPPATADPRHDALVTAHITAAMLLVACGALAVTNPEYIALVAPLVVLTCVYRSDVVWLCFAALLPWATDAVFAGLRRGPGGHWPWFGQMTNGALGHRRLVNVHHGLTITTSIALLAAGWLLATRTPAGVYASDSESSDSDSSSDSSSLASSSGGSSSSGAPSASSSA